MRLSVFRSRRLQFTLLALCLSGLMAYIFLRQKTSSNTVLTKPVARQNLMEAVYGIGTVKAQKTYDLNPGINAIIQETFVKEGDHVKKNQPLVMIDGRQVRSPFEGTITYFPFKKGEIIFPGNKVLSLVNFSDRYLVVNLEQEGALKVRAGQKGKINFDSIREQTFEGKVESVYSQEERFLARIGISHLPFFILPGMTADVAIGIKEHKEAIVVPIAALQDGYVLVKASGKKKEKRPVKIGINDGQMAEILSGNIHEGEQLIIVPEIKD